MDIDLDENAQILIKINQWVSLINSSRPEEMLEGVVGLRKILCVETSPPYDQVFSTGVVPRLITFLDPAAPEQLQFESCWCISNLASGTSAHTKEIVDKGALLPLIKLISSSNNDVSEQSTWAIGNISGDCPQHRNEALNYGVLSHLIELAQKATNVGILRRLSWTISNLCRGSPPPALHMVLPALNVLNGMIHYQDDEVVIDSMWAISYITGNNEGIQCVIDGGMVKKVIELMLSPNSSIMIPALRTVGNIASGNDIQTQTIINLGCLPIIFSLFSHTKRNVRKEAIWTASNIASGTPEQIQRLIDLSYFPELLRLYADPTFELTAKKEISWVLSNATNSTAAQIEYFVKIGFIQAFGGYLNKDCNTARDATVVLDGLENILKAGIKNQTITGKNNYITVAESCAIPTVLSELMAKYASSDELVEKIEKIFSTCFEVGEVLEFSEMSDLQDYEFVDNMKSLSVNK